MTVILLKEELVSLRTFVQFFALYSQTSVCESFHADLLTNIWLSREDKLISMFNVENYGQKAIKRT